MSQSCWRRIALALAGCVCSYGQTQIRGPVVAPVYDAASHSIRPIGGVLGAAMLGAPIMANVDWADVAPNGKRALAVQAGQLEAISGLDGNPTAAPIATVGACCLLAAWSEDSNTAALYRDGELLLVSGLNASPEVSRTDVSGIAGAVTFVLLDSNSKVVFGVEGNASGVYSFARNGLPRLVARLDHPRAAALLNGRVAIEDAGAQKIFQLQPARGSDGLTVVADLSNDAADPVGLAVWSNRLLVADRSSKSVLVFELATGQITSRLPVDISPTGMKAVAPGSLFLLGGGGTDPLYLFDARNAGSVYFVPAGGTQ